MNPIIKLSIKTFGYLLFGCLIALLVSYSFSMIFSNYNSESYFLSIVDKHDKFQKRKTTNNLIVIGGSSNAFGINSTLLDSTLNMNTMNFGVHGDIGCAYWISEAMYEAKPGDVILVNFEYELTQENLVYGGKEIYQAFFQSNGGLFKYGTYTHLYNYLYFGGVVLRDNILSYKNNPAKNIDPVYHRKAFNEKGDIQSQSDFNKNNWSSCDDSTHFKRVKFIPHNGYIKRLLDLDDYCKNSDIDLLISFPPIAVSSFNENASDSLYQMLSETDLNLINHPLDGMLCDTLFVGTNYHLTKCGRNIYSKKLANAIKKALPANN